METCEEDFAERGQWLLKRQKAAGQTRSSFWVSFTHMHLRTHTKAESLGQAGRWQSPYHDTMIDHDKNVGTVLKALDDWALAEDTIVMYSTDNGPHMNTWPDGGHDALPQREEFELGRRLSRAVHGEMAWPRSRRDQSSMGSWAHLDWVPTILAAAGVPDVKEQAPQRP